MGKKEELRYYIQVQIPCSECDYVWKMYINKTLKNRVCVTTFRVLMNLRLSFKSLLIHIASWSIDYL